jgi:hypothetical protein
VDHLVADLDFYRLSEGRFAKAPHKSIDATMVLASKSSMPGCQASPVVTRYAIRRITADLTAVMPMTNGPTMTRALYSGMCTGINLAPQRVEDVIVLDAALKRHLHGRTSSMPSPLTTL